MISDRMDINRVLAEMRSIKAQAQSQTSPGDIASSPIKNPLTPQKVDETPNFGSLLNRAVNNVNDLQSASNQMAKSYEEGQAGIDITDVMIASQKASVSFQSMVQVRNKLVEAYRDVMNMPV